MLWVHLGQWQLLHDAECLREPPPNSGRGGIPKMWWAQQDSQFYFHESPTLNFLQSGTPLCLPHQWLAMSRPHYLLFPGTPGHSLQGPPESTMTCQTPGASCSVLLNYRRKEDVTFAPPPSAGRSLSRLFLPWVFNCHLKGVLVILIMWINHKPILVDNIAIKTTESEMFQPKWELMSIA